MKSSNFLILTILLLSSLFSGALMAERLPTYEDIHQELVAKVDQVKDQVLDRFPTDSYVELTVIKDRDLYLAERTIRVVLSEKPYGDYFWLSTFKLKHVYFSNIDEKFNELTQLIDAEIAQRLEGQEAVVEAHSQADDDRSFNDSSVSVGGMGKYFSVWVQLPSIGKDKTAVTDVRWMRTTVRQTKTLEEDSHNIVSIRSVIWSLRHQESYYDEAKAGIVELGAIEGSLDFASNGDLDGSLLIDLIRLDQTQAFDINQTLSFFYTVGIGLAVDLVFKDDSLDDAAYAEYKARIGVSFGDNVVLSGGSTIKTDHKDRGYINTDLSLTYTKGDVSISAKAGFLHNGNMDLDAYQLTEGWYLGLFFSVQLD